MVWAGRCCRIIYDEIQNRSPGLVESENRFVLARSVELYHSLYEVGGSQSDTGTCYLVVCPIEVICGIRVSEVVGSQRGSAYRSVVSSYDVVSVALHVVIGR